MGKYRELAEDIGGRHKSGGKGVRLICQNFWIRW